MSYCVLGVLAMTEKDTNPKRLALHSIQPTVLVGEEALFDVKRREALFERYRDPNRFSITLALASSPSFLGSLLTRIRAFFLCFRC